MRIVFLVCMCIVRPERAKVESALSAGTLETLLGTFEETVRVSASRLRDVNELAKDSKLELKFYTVYN